MSSRTNRSRSPQPAKRGTRLFCERLEDRWVPHSGVTTFSTGITAAAAPTGIVRGPDDNLWFAEFSASRISRITLTGTVTEFTLPAGRGPLNITVGPDNNLWFTENTGDRIGRINPQAGNDAAIQASITEFTVPGVGSAPNDIAAGPDGALWFSQSGSDQIGRISTAGVVTEFVVPGAGSMPSGIAAGADGALWFTQGGSGQIGRISTAGTVTEFTVPVGSGGFSDPEDIIAGPGGALFFTDFGRDQIGRITTAGAITQFNLPTGRGPQGITAAPDGDLYFTEAASSRIGRLSASALIPGKPTSGSPPLEEFDFIARDSTPLGITTDSKGDIWFTLNSGNAIGTFLAHLEQITVTATGTTAQVFDRNLKPVSQFTPFPGFAGAFHVAVSDLNGNGIPDTIAGAGPGGGPHVKVFDGSDNRLLASFFAFDPNFRGGISLASDDVNGDGRPDIIVAAGSQIKVIDGFKLNQLQANGQIADSALLANFFAFDPSFTGDVTLASLDFNGDVRNDIVVAAGPGGGPHVKVIDSAKLSQVQANGQIAESALLASFFAFDPSFTGGVSVAVGFNDVQRKLIVGAGPGGGPHVKVIDGAKLNQVLPNGQIADSALLASFFAFAPSFRGGVRVSADDITSDGLAEVILSAGPGGGPHVKVVDGSKLGQVQANGQIAESALLASYFTADPGFSGGVFIASDADHRDARFGPPNVTVAQSRGDVNDLFIFQSPVTATNTVLGMTVSPFSTSVTPNAFDPNVTFDQRIVNRDLLGATDDVVFRYNFGPPDALAGGRQDVQLRALPAAKFPGVGGVLVKGFTGQNLAVRGVGPGAQFRAAEQSDPFFFDASGFNSGTNPRALLNHTTAVAAVVAGDYPRGTSPNGFGPGSTPNFDAQSFFAGANTLAIVLELPSVNITGVLGDAVGYWGRAEIGGVQTDRTGRPAINTALIPPVPRGANFPIGGTTDQNRQERRDAFNAGHPRDDRANFGSDMVSVLTAFYPAGRPGGTPNAPQAQVVANLLLPDVLVFRPSQAAGFFGDVATFNGTAFLAGGRKFSDNIIDAKIQVLTDDDLPAALGGGPNQPALVTQNVRDHNGQNLPDGSIDKSIALGGMGTGQRPAIFPYIGAPNVPAAPIPTPPGPIKP